MTGIDEIAIKHEGTQRIAQRARGNKKANLCSDIQYFIKIIMGQIQIENMEFYSFHGHFKEEQIVGNKFLVDLVIVTDMKLPAGSDNLKDAVDYQRIYQITKLQMEKKSHLLEHIAGRIIDAIYAEMEGIQKITVKVSKMNPPMGGKIGSVSIVLSR
jgi:7,8-dihydroneopterin aldolase/epimerase/oxygenase